MSQNSQAGQPNHSSAVSDQPRQQPQPTLLEQQEARREVEEAGSRLQQQLASVGLSLEQLSKKDDQRSFDVPDLSFNSKGQRLYTNKEIQEMYKNTNPLTRWRVMPSCRKTIDKKCGFWLVVSPVIAYSYGFFLKMRTSETILGSEGKVKSIPFKYYAGYALIATIMGSLFSVAQTYLLDDVWYDLQQPSDINSYHYDPTEDRLALSRKIKTAYRKKS